MIKRSTCLLLLLCTATTTHAQTNRQNFIDTTVYKTIKVKPSATNAAITSWDTAHAVYYNPALKNNKLLLWLTGTNGTSNNVPAGFFTTALAQGYRVIALSYISVPAVSQVCIGANLAANSNCAADFRRRRIYGDNNFSLIPDQPQDAIIPRLVKLLQYLVATDTAGHWAQYLSANRQQPAWSVIAIAGQSQGGGMAQYIAQQETVARVISFSGGWDYADAKDKAIAGWYFNSNRTPMQNWYATYHVNEMAAASIAQISTALGIPATQVFALDKPLQNAGNASGNANPYHGEGIRNTVYRPIWLTMLGSGL